MEEQKSISGKLFQLILNYNTEIFLFALIIVAGTISDVFLSFRNLTNILLQATPIGLLSLGMLLVILTGGIDLSVGSYAALGGVLIAFFLSEASLSLPLALIITLIIGALGGLIIGWFVAYRKMASFIVTLAFMSILRGAAYIISEGSPISFIEPRLSSFGLGAVWLIPYPIFVLLVIYFIFYFINNYSTFGRIIKGIGSNEEAVKLSGINTSKYKLAVFSLSGLFSTLGGIVIAARTMVGSPMVGVAYELDAIACVVIGGASLKGGVGRVYKTLIGALILGIISNIMNLQNVPAYPQQVVRGLIILAAVFFEGVRRKYQE